jgi:isocitrate/isopropylmalate dehydrogenase
LSQNPTGQEVCATAPSVRNAGGQLPKDPAAVFLGAIGHPDVKPGILEVGILLKTRFALDQYINLRPVKLYPNVETPLKDKGPEHIDFVVVRENTGGIYTGIGIKQDYNHVDACTMWFVKQPEYYDVIVTENLFGDIITDLAAIIQGGLGIAAGGNINPEGVSMFEPMGGSAPKYTGMNIINPLATISAGGMMMDTLGEPAIAKAVDKAVNDALASGKIKSLSAGKMGMGTREVGDMIAKLVS